MRVVKRSGVRTMLWTVGRTAFAVVCVWLSSAAIWGDTGAILHLITLGLAALPVIHAAVMDRDLFAPITILCVLYGVAFGLVPILEITGWVRSDPAYAAYDPSYGMHASLLSIGAILLVYLAYYEGNVATILARALPVLRGRLVPSRARFVTVVLFLVSGIALAAIAAQLEVRSAGQYFRYTNVSAFGRGHLAFFATLYVAAGYLAIMAVFSRDTMRKRAFVVALALAALLTVLSRARGQVLLLAFTILVFVHYRYRRLRAGQLVNAFAVALLIVFVMGQLRGNQNLAFTKQNVADAFGGLFTEHQATAALLAVSSRAPEPYTYGRIVLEDALFSLIPRRIWTSKPQRYGGVLITDRIIPNRQPGYYYTVGPFAAGYTDFGVIGVGISMLTMGFLMRVVYEYLKRNVHHDGLLLLYALFSFSLWAFVRGGFGFMPVILQYTLLVLTLATVVGDAFAIQPRRARSPTIHLIAR